MRYEQTFTLRDGGRAVITFPERVAPPVEGQATGSIGAPRRPRPRRRPCPLVGRVFDAGTLLVKDVWNGLPADDYHEDLLEGPVGPGYTILYRNAEILERLASLTGTLESGEVVSGCYPLQTDAETAASNTTVVIESERGDVAVALAEANDGWVAPEPVAAQRATIARLRDVANLIPQTNNTGLDTWEARLDQRDLRRWNPPISTRIDSEGELRMHAVPGVKRFGIASEWQYEPWMLGDDARYLVTTDPSAYGREIDSGLVRLNRQHATDVDLYLAPQLHHVRFDWLTEYLINVGWWAFTVFYPQTRTMTLRSALFPHTFTPGGIPAGSNPVGITMSERIGLTSTFAAAIQDDVNLSLYNPIFQMIVRVQGRYGVYQLPFQGGALCAEIVLRRTAGEERVRVFRRPDVEIDRPFELLEVSGLFVSPYVFPWSAGFEIEGPGGLSNPTEISDGY